jgi:hypothetical protein
VSLELDGELLNSNVAVFIIKLFTVKARPAVADHGNKIYIPTTLIDKVAWRSLSFALIRS